MTLDTPWHVEQTWGGSQAVLQGVVQGLLPQSIIECGCGNFSTPILRKAGVPLLTIEHDVPWAKKIQAKYPHQQGTHNYLIHPIPGAHNGRAREEVNEHSMDNMQRFYNMVATDVEPCDFLLIDTYRCARVPAALTLAPKAHVVMLHDVEPPSREYYDYHLLDEMFRGWYRYEHRPNGKVNKVHATPWTALYSRKPLDLDALQPAIVAESQRLWGLPTELEEIHGS